MQFRFEVDVKDEDTGEYRNVGAFNDMGEAVVYMIKTKEEGLTIRLTWMG